MTAGYDCHSCGTPIQEAPTNKRFADYGGRGITVCDRWRESFENFLADMGPRPSPKHSLDRKDNSKGYDADNCRWATSKEQNRNKRTTVMLTVDGHARPLIEWCEPLGLDAETARKRMRRGLSGKAVLLPSARNAGGRS